LVGQVAVKFLVFSSVGLSAFAELFLKRKLSFPVSRMWQWWVRRSSSAVVRRSNQRLTGALLDRLTHHVHILEMNGESYRLKQSKARRRKEPQPAAEPSVDPETGKISPS
jgi:hypothetical protein